MIKDTGIDIWNTGFSLTPYFSDDFIIYNNTGKILPQDSCPSFLSQHNSYKTTYTSFYTVLSRNF